MFGKNNRKIVKEDFYCEHWEPNDEALVPMKECWCCKWSEFRKTTELSKSSHTSACTYGRVNNAIN